MNLLMRKTTIQNLIEKSENYTNFIQNINKNYRLNKYLLHKNFKEDKYTILIILIFLSSKK